MTFRPYLILAMIAILVIIIAGCGNDYPVEMGSDTASNVADEPESIRVFGETSDTVPKELATVGIDGLGSFTFNPVEITTVRPDIFKPGYFSLFDVLVHLSETGRVELAYSFDESMNTYVIEGQGDVSPVLNLQYLFDNTFTYSQHPRQLSYACSFSIVKIPD